MLRDYEPTVSGVRRYPAGHYPRTMVEVTEAQEKRDQEWEVKPMLYRLQLHLQPPGSHSPMKTNATPAAQDVPTPIGIGKSPSYVTNCGETLRASARMHRGRASC